MNDFNRCVACGDLIPEGRMVCPTCEAEAQKSLLNRLFPVHSKARNDFLLHALERVEDAVRTAYLALAFVCWCVICFLVATL
jgi:hypothetical protein